MTGLGTLVNMAAILIGSGLGLLLKNGIPKRLQTTISSLEILQRFQDMM